MLSSVAHSPAEAGRRNARAGSRLIATTWVSGGGARSGLSRTQPSRIARPSVLGQYHLGLGHDRDQAAGLGADAGLPDLRAPAAMDRRRLADQRAADRRRRDEVGLALDRRGPRALGQVDDR